jgi:hypothetical protein
MIVIFVGAQGSGKTISIVKYLIEDFSKGKNILTNFGMNKINYNFLSKKMLLDYSQNQEQIKNTSIGITELHTVIDSRASGKNKFMTWFFLQLRKRGVTLYGDTQHFGQIDKRVRDETDLFIECQTFLLNPETGKLNPSFKKEFTPEEFDNLFIKNKCYIKFIISGVKGYKIKSYYFKAKDVAPYYDTNEVIDISH